MFTENAKKVISIAEQKARASGGIIGTEHILYGLLQVKEGSACKILRQSFYISDIVLEGFFKTSTFIEKPQLSDRTKILIKSAEKLAHEIGSDEIGTLHLLFGLLGDMDSYASRFLREQGVDVLECLNQVMEELGCFNVEDKEEFDGIEDSLGELAGANFSGFSPFMQGGAAANISNDNQSSEIKGIKGLDGLGVDLTQKAREGKLDPIIGRSKEIDRIIQVLSRRTKNNPVLIGEPGVGKTAVVEGLAQAIIEGKVPEMLKNKRIFALEMVNMVAGTKYRGEFEKRMKDAITAIKKAGDIIVFIDEIHNIVGAGGSEGAVDAASIIKPMLARGEMQTIGATTINEYRLHIEKDSALERRFQPIMVDPPTVEDTILILNGLKEKYENHHKVAISDEAVRAAAKLSDRYITDRFLPDKAIDLIDEACSKKRISSLILPPNLKELEDKVARLEIEINQASKAKNFKLAAEKKDEQDVLSTKLLTERKEWISNKRSDNLSIDANDIAEIVSLWTSIPVVQLTEAEAERLLNLEKVLGKRVVGQAEAVSGISKAVRRARAGLKDPNRPIGSFIFLGPTGVGKTELCKALAEAMFGDENLMIRFDMSEYMDKQNVSKMIGSAPGFVGYDEGGQLTEKVRRKPYSVVLFDEIEKAHSDVFNILLQILEDGRLTDSHGRTVSFKNCIIIMTSNIGASEIGKMKSLGFGNETNAVNDYDKMKEKQLEALKGAMRPELINRIDEIIIFHKLERGELERIASLMIDSLAKRLEQKDIHIELDEKAKELIIEQGYDAEYGARPLRRAVQKLLEDELSEEILKGNIKIGEKVFASASDKKMVFSKEKNSANTIPQEKKCVEEKISIKNEKDEGKSIKIDE